MITEKNKKILIRHKGVTWFFVFLLAGCFLFGDNVLAVNDYNKAVNGSLSASEWNALVNDFVKTYATSSTVGPFGIGTTNPQGKFNISADNGAPGNLTATQFVITGTTDPLKFFRFGLNTTDNYAFFDAGRYGSASYNTILGQYGGNVGIGTTNTSAYLSFLTFSGKTVDLGGGRIGNLGDPIDLQDAATRAFVQDTVGASSFWTAVTGGIQYSSGNVGIGTNNPTAKLEIVGPTSVGGDWTTSNAQTISFNASGLHSALYGLNSSAYATDNNPYTVVGVKGYGGARGWNNGTAGFTLYGVVGGVGIMDSGANKTIPSAISLYASGNSVSGSTISNYYGLYLSPASLGGGSITNRWGVYQEDVAARNYFGGNIGIGTNNPSSKLTIFGGDLEMSHNTSIKVSSSTVDTTLLFGNYADGLGFSYGTSTAPTNKTVTLAVEGDVKANRFCIGEDCKDTWQQIVYAGGGGNAVFVGLTAKTNGNNNGTPGYKEAFRLCNTAFTGSHVCTPDDMLNTIALNSLMPTEDAWVFSGPPGYTALANDCDGRTSTSNSGPLGAYWEVTNPSYPNGGHGLTSPCGANLKIACCK